ncbi:hypothetical protein GOODEAATRI_005577 [Goodea atripinnis]|uniref:Uncharacterized protein n=1 Tax=Goodea atripinnis TaxID=208336 RepID=A0ABV0PVK9_9TELE
MEKMEKVQLLEPIQEESEQEDETIERRQEEKEEEEAKEDKSALQVGVEAEEVVAEDEREEDVLLRLLRPGRRSGSLRRESLIQIQLNKQKNETENSLVLDASTHATDVCEEAAPLPIFENERRSSSGKRRIKVSKIKGQKQIGLHQPKKKKRLRCMESLLTASKFLGSLAVVAAWHVLWRKVFPVEFTQPTAVRVSAALLGRARLDHSMPLPEDRECALKTRDKRQVMKSKNMAWSTTCWHLTFPLTTKTLMRAMRA